MAIKPAGGTAVATQGRAEVSGEIPAVRDGDDSSVSPAVGHGCWCPDSNGLVAVNNSDSRYRPSIRNRRFWFGII